MPILVLNLAIDTRIVITRLQKGYSLAARTLAAFQRSLLVYTDNFCTCPSKLADYGEAMK
jgi:hypothetical protein